MLQISRSNMNKFCKILGAVAFSFISVSSANADDNKPLDKDRIRVAEELLAEAKVYKEDADAWTQIAQNYKSQVSDYKSQVSDYKLMEKLQTQMDEQKVKEYRAEKARPSDIKKFKTALDNMKRYYVQNNLVMAKKEEAKADFYSKKADENVWHHIRAYELEEEILELEYRLTKKPDIETIFVAIQSTTDKVKKAELALSTANLKSEEALKKSEETLKKAQSIFSKVESFKKHNFTLTIPSE